MLELIRRAPRLAGIDRERDWLDQVVDVERGCRRELLGESILDVGDAGQRSPEGGGKLLCAGDGDDGVVNCGTDGTAAVGREHGFVGHVVGWACEDGAECADLSGLRSQYQRNIQVLKRWYGLTVTGVSRLDPTSLWVASGQYRS